MYTIKELAEKTGIIPNAIRFYEKKGLLKPERTESNYRVYSAEDVTRLEQILLYRKMGFSIEDIKELLEKNSSPIDQSINMLKEAKKKCPGVKLLKGDFLNLPLESKSCDAIVISYAFHHCDGQEKKLAMEEMNRVLKSAGVIVIADLMFENQKARERFAVSCSEREREDLEDEYFGNVDEVTAVFKTFGYQCEAEQVDELIWIITARK